MPRPIMPRYEQVFGVPAEFGWPYHYLSIPAAYLARSMALANPATVKMCEQQCEARLASVASALHTSGRSLRRHLAKMGSSYQQVLDEVRKKLALQYLPPPICRCMK